MTKVNREWEIEYDPIYLGKLCAQTNLVERIGFVDKYVIKLLSQTRNDLLREIMEEMPKYVTKGKAKLKSQQDFYECAVDGFNDALDQVNTILESKLSTVKK